MFTVSAVRMLNEAGQTPLGPDEMWRAMVHHVRTGDPRFVPPEHAFELVEDGEREILRRALLGEGARRIELLQRVSLHADRAMMMSTLGGMLNLRILSIEADRAGAYYLRLSATACAKGAAHASPEEQELAGTRQAAAEASVAQFVEAARSMAQNGELVRKPVEQSDHPEIEGS